MFRSRRNNLVKRLWKVHCRAQTESGDEVSEGNQLKAVLNTVLKRLKEDQLETLVAAVESGGGQDTACVLVPKDPVKVAGQVLTPQTFYCRIWRWPDYSKEYALKRLGCCGAGSDPASECCNPFHWSRLVQPDYPPPPYSSALIERVVNQEQSIGVNPPGKESTECGMTPTEYQCTDGSFIRGGDGLDRGSFWCNLAYWEHRQRVGRLFEVWDSTVNVFQELPHGSGLCLKVLQTETQAEVVRRTREKIGFGIVLSKEGDGVWLYNRSKYPAFVNSPTLDIPNSPVLVVVKVLPGFSLKIFDYEQSEELERTHNPDYRDGPYDPNAVRISFVKGWGPSYSRQMISSCPCWLELLLRVNR